MTAAPLKIAFLMTGVGILNRGAEAFVLELCEALGRREGFEVTLLCRGEAPLPHRRIRALPRDQPLVGKLYGATRLGRKVLDTLFLDPLNLEWSTAALAAFPTLWKGRFDLIVMEGGLVGAGLCRLLRRLRGTPFVDIAHGNSPKWEGAFARQHPDRVVAFTEAAAEMIRGLAPKAQIEVIPHGVDLELFHPPGSHSGSGVETPPPELSALARPVVLTAGAVDAHKQPALTLEAVASHPTASLVVLGQGPEAENLDRLAAQRLGPRRYLRHRVERREMPRWYRAADAFALASRTEAFGLVYIEAMACGLPCVATDDAVRRAVIGDAGRVCDVEVPEAYGHALRDVLKTDWGDRPRRQAERFPFAETARRYTDLFQELVGPGTSEEEPR